MKSKASAESSADGITNTTTALNSSLGKSLHGAIIEAIHNNNTAAAIKQNKANKGPVGVVGQQRNSRQLSSMSKINNLPKGNSN